MIRDFYADEFCRTFGEPLKRFLGDNILGFDVLRFDEQVVTPQAKTGKDESMSEAILRHWGLQAQTMIAMLVKPPPPGGHQNNGEESPRPDPDAPAPG